MVADFNAKKVDLKKVSQNVKDFVANVAKTEGSKKKIDSEREYNQLSLYLCGAGNGMNNDEIGYIQGFMFEYQNKQNEKFEKDFVTENTKKEISKIAKRMGDKKKIDTDEEAQALAIMLRNSHNELNAADLAYIQQLLIKSGYGHYLQPEGNSVTIVNIQVQQETSNEINKTEEINCDKPVENCKPIKKRPVKKFNNSAKKEADRAKKEADRSKAEADRSAREADRSKAEADRAKKEADSIKNAPKVSEKARAQGFGIANKIQENLHDLWTNDDEVEKELNRLTSENAYSFVGKMMEVTDEHNVFGSFYKRVSAETVRHVIAALLGQAKNIGLQKDPAYKTLVETYKFIKRQYVDKDPKNPIYDRRDIEELDLQVKQLYNKMSQVFK